jgi:hypothetical protein
MQQPDNKAAGSAPAAAPTSIPIEALIESMKAEKPLVIEGSTGSFGSVGANISSGGGSAAGAAPQQ